MHFDCGELILILKQILLNNIYNNFDELIKKIDEKQKEYKERVTYQKEKVEEL